MKANSEKTKQSKKATRRVLAGVLCGASVLSLVLSLVMPPISQAIANDAEAGAAEKTVAAADSSTESTDVENTNNGDTKKLNSGETEGGETGDDSQPEEQPEEEQQNEGTTTSAVETVAAVAENEQTKTAAEEITNANELHDKLEGVREGKKASFELTSDIVYNDEIFLRNSGSNITLDLNGCKIMHSGEGNKPLFSVSNGAEFTITDFHSGEDKIADTQPLQGQDQKLVADNYGKTAEMSYVDDVPTKLTYYVTKSNVDTTDSTRTNETIDKHEVTIKGAIVGTKDSAMKLINVYTGGTFNLQGGVLTTTQNAKVGNLIYAENGSTVNMSGGYVCGAHTGTSGTGAGIMVSNASGNGSILNLTGGVIAGNYAPDGGGVYANGSTINMTSGTPGGAPGGTISGNGTFEDKPGFGAGICALGSTVYVKSGYITNNNCQFNYMERGAYDDHNGNGCHGGGGIAAYNGGSLTIEGGYITGNRSIEAGGGIYAGAWGQALSSFTFSGGTIASNVAQNSEGGGIRIAAPTIGKFNVPLGTKAYITNNKTNTFNDWGGGGVFVQGSSDNNAQSASLEIYNALITKNDAQGFGGGFAACPTGETAITDTDGIAIFGNTDANGKHRSKGTHEKTDDADTSKGGEITGDFIEAGHQDLFLIRDSTNPESLPYIAAVTGQMLGGGAANWKGTIDNTPTSIGKYEGAQAKYMIGLRSDSSVDDQNVAKGLASLYITGNESNVHGGGIMTNGKVVAGSTTEVKVYPKMKLNGTKALTGRKLEKDEFEFELLKQNPIVDENGKPIVDENGKPLYTVPSFDSKGALQLNGCSVVNTVKNDGNGKFTFDLGEVYADDALVYYLVEVPGTDKDVAYDKTIYRIDPQVVKDDKKSHNVLGIEYTYYTVESVALTKIAADGSKTDTQVKPENEDGIACVALTDGATFTNYIPSGVWTPKATKVVEGGEMKGFTLKFADNEKFEGGSVRTVKTDATGDTTQTLSFLNASREGIKYSLSDITKDPYTHGDSTGRGASKTFTYYVCEKDENSTYPHYKFDQSVYKLNVTMAVQKDGRIVASKVTYTKIKDRNGNKVTNDTDHDLTDTSTPTFTNTYSTSLPLSGMSGVTLTYLAGAAVLCAAAAWMHIRRKANAKGGKRRE